MPEPKFSIVLPFYGRWELVMARLSELYSHAPAECEILLVNDCSPDTEALEGNLAWWQKNTRHMVRYLRNKENLGFGGSMNRGAAKARGEIIILLSSDVQITGNFIALIEVALRANPKRLVGGRLIDWPAGWNVFQFNGKPLVIPWIEGWLVACTRAAWEELGGFDPIYGRFDYEDCDLSTRALELGYELYPLNTPFLHHLSGATISTLKVDRPAVTQRNRAAYIEKWKDRLPQIHDRLAKEVVYSGISK